MLNIDNSSFANAGLQLFGVNDPIFIERFPPQQNGATPSSLGISAPYTVLLTNDSGRALATVVVVYDLGNGILRIQVLSNSSQFGESSANLIGPSFNFAQSFNLGKLTLPLTSAQSQEVETVVSLFNSRTAVKVYIDGVIWADTGKFEGPNTSHAFDALQQQAKARTDFLALVSPLTGEALITALQKIPQPEPTATLATRDFYGHMMFQLAQTSISMIGQAGETFWRSNLKFPTQ